MEDRVPRKVAFYIRVSDRSQNYDSQKSEMMTYIARRGWPEPLDEHIYCDVAMGAKARRPNYNRMICDAESKHFDALVVWRTDRLARYFLGLVNLGDLFNRVGVDLVSVTEPIDTSTPQGVLMFQILAALGQYQRHVIRENNKAGREEKARKGEIRTGGRKRKINYEEIAASIVHDKLTWKEVRLKYTISNATIARAMDAYRNKDRVDAPA